MKITNEVKIRAQEKIIESSLPIDRKLKIIKEIENLREIGDKAAIAIAASYTALIAIAIAAGDKWYSYYGRKCVGLKDSESRRICRFNVKIEAFQHEIQLLNKMKTTHCPKTKDPDKCKLKLNQKIRRLEEEQERLEHLLKKGKHDIKTTLRGGIHPAYINKHDSNN